MEKNLSPWLHLNFFGKFILLNCPYGLMFARYPWFVELPHSEPPFFPHGKYISCFTGTLCCFYYQFPFFYLSTLTFDKFCFDLLVYTFFPFGYNFFVLMLRWSVGEKTKYNKLFRLLVPFACGKGGLRGFLFLKNVRRYNSQN